MIRAITKEEAQTIILTWAVRGSPSEPLPDGRQVMCIDRWTLVDRHCRRDAVGRRSTADQAAFAAAFAALTLAGVIAGELNGYPLLNRGAARELQRKGAL